MPITPDDLKEIQGDIIHGIPKRNEAFLFFIITDAKGFKTGLTDLIPLLKYSSDIQQVRSEIAALKQSGTTALQPVTAVNIAFSGSGLEALGFSKDLGDKPFQDGQYAHASTLNDKMKTDSSGNLVPDWIPEFSGDIHGVILSAGESKLSVNAGILAAEALLALSIKKVYRVDGNVRPEDQKGHEHFGYMDGISSPAITGVTPVFPGQQVIQPGILICGQDGDPISPRPQPTFTKNGSFFVYRHLNQLVPEFNKFIVDSAPTVPTIPPGPNPGIPPELFAARLMGRWKSGAPTQLAFLTDNPDLAKDPQRNNDFDYSYDPNNPDQSKCPFVAHVRKVAPRSFLTKTGQPAKPALRQIMRQGIPFGPELTQQEISTNKTIETRGLAFVCYQSSIENGFKFIQTTWSNPAVFPAIQRGTRLIPIGQDPIIGQAPGGGPREVYGMSKADETVGISFPSEFVVPQGGAYFFSPSRTALGMLTSGAEA